MVVEIVVLQGEDSQVETYETPERLDEVLTEAGPAMTAAFIAFQQEHVLAA